MKKFFTRASAFLLLIPSVALAHTAGQSFETNVGDYLLDAGCVAPEFIAGQQTYCSFGLVGNAGGTDWYIVPSDSIELTVENDAGDVITEKSVPPEQDVLTFTDLTFPEAGDYQVTVRFLSGSVAIADHSFTALVSEEGGWTGNRTAAAITLVALAAAGILATVSLMRPKRSR